MLKIGAEKFFDRRLQTVVFTSGIALNALALFYLLIMFRMVNNEPWLFLEITGLAESQHHARVLVKQRHIRVGKRLVNVPGFMVRLDSAKHIEFATTSPFGEGLCIQILFIYLFI